jgi:hypothetical protein
MYVHHSPELIQQSGIPAMPFFITITHENESLARIYGDRWFFLSGPDSILQHSPIPEPVMDYEAAQRTFFAASDWMDRMIRDCEMPDSTVTLRGPNGIFRSHTLTRSKV